jgi:hypothetical protein
MKVKGFKPAKEMAGKDSRKLTAIQTAGKKQISSLEQGMSNHEVFFLRYSLFLVRYSAVLFFKSLDPLLQLNWGRANN